MPPPMIRTSHSTTSVSGRSIVTPSCAAGRGRSVAPGTGAAPWVLGGIISLVGLLGLIAASATGDGPVYVIGLVVFLVSVLSIFALIARFAGRKGPGACAVRA